MKTGIYVLIAIASILVACREPKIMTEEEDVEAEQLIPTEERNEILTIRGTVKLNPECGATIRVIQGDLLKYYHPVNLPEEFIVEGIKLEMESREIMAKMPAGCEYMIPVSVSNVRKVE